jgi:P4 family phage/plasmid primase-like protien
VSSTDAEKAVSHERALACRAWLLNRAWPPPILGDSGNGFHLLYSIDLPNDQVHHDLAMRVLQTLSQRFSDDAVKLDTTVANASRITKLYGTWARKGAPTAERPHRRSALLEVPRAPGNVSLRQLQELAALFEKKPRPRPAYHTNGTGSESTGHAKYAEVEAALAHINPDPRDVWLQVGAALQDELGENGRGLWDIWSARSNKYDAADQDRTWRRFEAGAGLTIRTLFKLAYDGGWPGAHANSGSTASSKTKKGEKGPKPAKPCAAAVAESISADDHFAQDVGGGLYYYAHGVYNAGGEKHVRQRVRRLVEGEDWSSHLANETVEYITVGSPILPETPSLAVLNVQNGLLNVHTRELSPHSPKHLSSIQLPVTYNPQAACPAWDKQLADTAPADVAEAGVIFQLVAWLMLAATWIQKAVLLLGPGGTGKSTLLMMILNFLGGHRNVSSLPLQRLESDRFAPARLVNKLANICADLPSTHLETSSMFKAITGGDPLPAERKFKDGFDFIPFARLLFSANTPPQSKDATEAFFQRWLVFPFDTVFRGAAGEVDRKELDARLAAPSELSGVLNRALAALPGVWKNGITVTESMRAAHEEFWRATDPLAIWLARNIVEQPLAVIPCQELITRYNTDAASDNRPSMTDTAFGAALKNLRPSIERKQRMVAGKLVGCYIGIGLRANTGGVG